uniref:Replicase n=1 Tax=Garlic virus A TaxID=12433 RepID=A0A6M2YVE1_9VIRU|nr:replicase [Garlic virus A]
MTAVQKLFDQISDPNTKAGYSNACFEAAQTASKKALAIAPFSVTNPEALTLERIGITTSPFATTSHTHAADKIIENDCLSIIGHYLPKKEAVTHIQLKRGKLHLLGRNPSLDKFQNYCYEPKDVLRYGLTNPNSCPKVDTEYAVLADTLHFMSPRQLYTLFSRNPKLERLFATLVLPIEAMHKLPSLFPDIYKLEYYNDHFSYMPGGHGGGAYVHSYSTLRWLNTAQVGPVDYDKSTITNPWPITDYLSIEKIETKAAHHIMLVQRRRAQVDWPLPTLWVFHASDYVKLPPIFYPPEANVQKTYPHVFIKRMQLYCFSVKAVSLRDIFAKLRQVIETQELIRYSMADLIRLANYLLFITGMNQLSDYESPLLENLFGKLCASIRMRLRTFFQNLLGKTSYAALLTVTDVIPVHFTTNPKRREAIGESWFRPDTDEFKPKTQPSQVSGPSPDDLDLLAWFHELENGAPTCPQAVSSSSTTPQTSEEPDSSKTMDATAHVTAPMEHIVDESFGTDAKQGNNKTAAACQTDSGLPPLDEPQLAANHENIQKPEDDDCISEDDNSSIDSLSECDDAMSMPSLEEIPDSELPDLDDLIPDIKTDSGKNPERNPSPMTCENAENLFSQATLNNEQGSMASPEPAAANKEGAADATSPEHTRLEADDVKTKTCANEGAGPHSNRPRLEPLDQETTDILKLHGFTALQPQHDGAEQIQPIYFNSKAKTHRRLEANELCPAAQPFAALATAIRRGIYNYKLCNRRATAYMSDVKNNLTGLVLPKLDRELLSSWVALAERTTREVGVLVIHGAGGAGKSRALQELLRNSPELLGVVNIVVPTINLANDWKKKLPSMDPRRVMTFEKACERECKTVTIFDDYGKLPAGFVDAYLAIKMNVELAILTGDQRQSTHHQDRESQIALLSSNVAHFAPYTDYYINATHRQPRRLANPIKVHAERLVGGSVRKSDLVPDRAMVLVPAFRSQSLLTDLGRQAMTYAGCQGLTLNHLTIVLDKDTPLCSEEVLYTAFSRASESITFVNTHSDNPDFLAKLDATPYLKTLISWVREDEQAGNSDPPPEPVVRDEPTKTHIPVTNDHVQMDDKVETMEDKDTRELWSGEEKTNLMQTQDPIVQLFPHQQAKDEALFKITINERIHTASSETNIKSLQHTLNAGDLLFEAYAQFMKVPAEPQAFDKRLWTHCRQLALRTYLSKPTANLQQGASRQDPDFPDNAIALFNKSQWVKKLEKVGAKFKAGQTISAFKQQVVLLTTTMALYLRKKREQHQPDNVFIMCERTPEQFNSFVMTKWDFTRPNYTSDYTQYDQSQDAPFLNFELRKARHLGVPDEVLAFYKFIKTHAKTFVGNLAIMRLSGEGPTFDANTECNIAYDALRFRLDDNVRACYAGDDLVRDKACEERAGWTYSEKLFSLKAKPLVTNKPDFCGWRLTPHGIVKSPIQLYQSLQLALRLGKVEDVKRSYAIDYLFAYRLGDKLYDIFDEEELEKHQLVTRTLIKKGMQPPESGNHLPTFHITSDRLIRDPQAIQIRSYESDRLLLHQPTFIDSYIPKPLVTVEDSRATSITAHQEMAVACQRGVETLLTNRWFWGDSTTNNRN